MRYINPNELYHHGIKGQKWGVRRYQNEDGSLTAAGKKRYDSMSPNKLQKELYKRVKSERKAQYGPGNQWAVNNTIGEHSKKAYDRWESDTEKYMTSEKYKKAQKESEILGQQWENLEIDSATYSKKLDQTWKDLYNPKLDFSVRISGNGREYVKEFLDSYGKDMNLGYLKDLGYSDSAAKYLNNKLMKADKKLLNGL